MAGRSIPALDIAIDRALLAKSYADFIPDAFAILEPNSAYENNWHVSELAAILQAEIERIASGQPKTNDIVINMPFRAMKSLIVSVFLPAWAWTRYPHLKFIYASYSADLSIEHSVLCRRLIESEWYQNRWGHVFRMASDQNAKSKFENDKGGFRRATSVGGSITGSGADVLVVDDPINPKQSASDAALAESRTWYDRTFYSRLNAPNIGVRLIVMQRLSENDLTGHLITKPHVRHICIPGELSERLNPPEWKRYYRNGLFWPTRFSPDILESYKTGLGSYGYAGQIMQAPAPEGGGIWQKWFVPIPDAEFPSRDKFESYGTDWDLAYTSKEDNSASAFVTAGRIGANYYLENAGAVWKEFPDLIRFMKSVTGPHYIEGKASGKSAAQVLRSEGIDAIEVSEISADKIARTRDVTPAAESGRCYVKHSVIDYLYYDSQQGILTFPNGSHNDLNDALTQSMKRLLYSFSNFVHLSEPDYESYETNDLY